MVPDMVSIGGFTACRATPVGSPMPFCAAAGIAHNSPKESAMAPS
jgi:hypothetical protein